ncbi:LytTR family DNA-binding domain-containing protein [Galbibacter sp. EGI 63066]|uniref:LytR/AlgR family response regulator transcription factor n=1 Tax=Galbibacter sp. EGI 63066 TaxID=2993559 RepID=UPI002248F084|nr:LytTR family DNA-binding domain-containing protein [Galbibacter sp. EGI 63066]MCX2679071.1 LytTR family DNA-binding domain-containing protein [Galbibacter sp. EGI 63066]
MDDEDIAHDIIKGYADLLPNLKLVQHCYDAIEANECLKKNKVDLIFLDLNMPKLKGFEFLKSLLHPPKVIVTTAYQEHALEGYELNIVDYLLKPFSFERFMKAINKIKDEKRAAQNLKIKKSGEDKRLFLYANKKHIQLILDDILFVEADGNYCKVVSKVDEIRIRTKLSDFIKILPESIFFQTHKSFIVSKKHIKTIEGNRISLSSYKIPIGKVYKASIKELLR